MLKRLMTAAAIGGSAAACAAVLTPAAAASKRVTATGSFTILTDNFTPIRTADGNTFAAETATLVYTSGALTGPAVDTDTSITYKDGSFKGVHGVEVCTGCTLAGRTGDFTAVFTYAGVPTATGFKYSGPFTVISATGGLAGLHLQGTFQGNEVGNTYSYHYSFGP